MGTANNIRRSLEDALSDYVGKNPTAEDVKLTIERILVDTMPAGCRVHKITANPNGQIDVEIKAAIAIDSIIINIDLDRPGLAIEPDAFDFIGELRSIP
jgi:hypothetical protein